MKKKLLFFVLMASVIHEISAQCLTDGITFSAQSQVDSFPINYPNCTVILGNVTIQGEDISNLNGLIGVESIFGNLHIGGEDYPFGGTMLSNDSLINLFGLDSLTTVEGAVNISANYALTTLDGLGNLDSIGGSLYIGYWGTEGMGTNPLVSLEGLEKLSFIGGHLTIGSQSLLNTLSGLESIVTIGGGITIEANESLSNLNGLDSLETINGSLKIWINASLINLSGLNNIDSINGSLLICDNGSLTSIIGLDSLQLIGGNLVVRNNNALTNLSGLDQLDYLTITELLIIENNNNLSICEVTPVCNYLENGGAAIVLDNAAGCNSVEEIEAACLVPAREVFFENNAIQIFPNPTSGLIQIDGKNLDDLEVRVWKNTGRIIKDYQITEYGQIDLSLMPSGLYFLELRNKDQVIIKKIIKE